MIIRWDERKRLANLDKHGLDFEAVSMAFFSNAHIRPAKLNRLQAIGMLDGECVAVIFAALGSEALSIISMRTASKVEKELLP